MDLGQFCLLFTDVSQASGSVLGGKCLQWKREGTEGREEDARERKEKEKWADHLLLSYPVFHLWNGTPSLMAPSVSHSVVSDFVTPWTVAHQAPLSMEFSRQGSWSGMPFPSPGDLPDPGTEPGSPALQANSLPSEPSGKPLPNIITSDSKGNPNPTQIRIFKRQPSWGWKSQTRKTQFPTQV